MQLDPDAEFNAQGGGNKDLYSINDGDSGMRVVLPGTPGAELTYYVRVRSTSPQVFLPPSFDERKPFKALESQPPMSLTLTSPACRRPGTPFSRSPRRWTWDYQPSS